jgi:transcriptional regulator with XRE-family HTH domain
MSDSESVYWDDLAEDLKDPDFLREFVLESIRIQTIDSIINQIEDAREAAGLSKADLARSVSAQPATIRRLLGSATASNPTLGTVSELAATLGYRVKLELIKGNDARCLATALTTGSTPDARRLVSAIESLDGSKVTASAKTSCADFARGIHPPKLERTHTHRC